MKKSFYGDILSADFWQKFWEWIENYHENFVKKSVFPSRI